MTILGRTVHQEILGEEAKRLIDSAGLDLDRPVLVVGLGLGYHVLELLDRGATVAVVESDPAVVKLALDTTLEGSTVLLGLGDADGIAKAEAFRTFAAKTPQVLVHPASARLHPGFAEAVEARLARAGIAGQRLGIAVVGPLYGGSLPIAGYLERAFQKLGHRTLFVDTSVAWPLYQSLTKTIQSKTGSAQLGELLVNVLNEWSYGQVVEFSPEICIVMAQAPVDNRFPQRLAKQDIVTAFWFIENWRHMGYWKDIAPFYDYFFHIQPGEFEQALVDAGCPRQAFVQTGCDPEIHKPVELTDAEGDEFGCEISFAGAGYHNRNQVFSGLTDYDLKLWGVEWSARELFPFVCRPDQRFTPEQFAKIAAATTINLNLHSSATHSGVDPKCDAINPRVFELAACGAFQLCDPCKGLENCFEYETELPVYRDLAELREKIGHFLAHPDEREAISVRARERALRDHTYEVRAQQMIDCVLDAYGTRILRKGIRAQRTMAEIVDRVGSDTELGGYLATFPADDLFLRENVEARIPLIGSKLSYPEAVFAYLREMRSSNAALLEEMD